MSCLLSAARLHCGDTGIFGQVESPPLWVWKDSSDGDSGDFLILHLLD